MPGCGFWDTGRGEGLSADRAAFFAAGLPGAGSTVPDGEGIPGVFPRLVLEGARSGDVVVAGDPGGGGWTVAVALATPSADG